MLRSWPIRVLASLLTLSAATGCFYDSTWGARKTAQIHNAARATPASLGAAAEASPPRVSGRATALRVRVHATSAYAAQTPDWKSHIGAILARAGEALEASVGANLVLETADGWEHVAGDRLAGDLAALREEDAGEGTDLVLGLLGGLPIATQSFEQLGMSEVRGKHLVVRAPNVASEYDAVEKAFDQLSARARATLLQERIRHREVAILLHEVGHALGAEHVTSEGSLMRPVYDPKMSAFDPDSIARMRRGLSHSSDGDAGAGEGADRESAAVRPPPASQPPVTSETPTELATADRELWRRASDLAKKGDPSGAWTVARPLFGRYPLVYGVLDLRCKLAMATLASFADVRAECEPLMKATLKGAEGNGKPEPGEK